jgi:hypothetical protein
MLRNYILYVVLGLLVAAWFWVRRVARQQPKLEQLTPQWTPASNTLMSTIMRDTPDALRSGEAEHHSPGSERDRWVRVPNSITGGKWRSDE